MCRNITTLRGLEPPATSEEVEAAARQYVRKVTGVQKLSDATRDAFEAAVAAVAAATEQVLDELPERRTPLPRCRRCGAPRSRSGSPAGWPSVRSTSACTSSVWRTSTPTTGRSSGPEAGKKRWRARVADRRFAGMRREA
ncbi:hypothetical protein GCM10025864_37840 [Luteimicrobium album]|uniref:DUF2277 domain-containing protein n=1 Tax=Luteimicrobium album TaxID=1054550 RepID=A0ABQ6I8G5_9MICO|nr:hypothetical protein GCM10025864_37840 [Luteimicrobium album]